MRLGRAKFFLLGVAASLVFGWWLFPKLLYTNEPQPVKFSHAVHTGEKAGMSCQDCHGFTENGTFSGVPNLEQCATCHAEPSGTTEEERRFVDEYVKQNREVPWGVAARQPDNVYFSHFPHVKKAAIECARCHRQSGTTTAPSPLKVNILTGYSRDLEGSRFSGIPWKASDGMLMSDCIDCHSERGRKSACIDCHK